jgi:hypothetical protein
MDSTVRSSLLPRLVMNVPDYRQPNAGAERADAPVMLVTRLLQFRDAVVQAANLFYNHLNLGEYYSSERQ